MSKLMSKNKGLGKDKIRNKRKANKAGILYKVWLAVSFVIIQFIRPVWNEKNFTKIIKGMMQVTIMPVGVVQVDTNRYITRKNGWEQLDKLLKKEGYKTHMLFRQCEFWKDEGIKKELKGKNIGEFFILWEGDII